MGAFRFGHVVFCGQSPYILNFFFLLEIIHQLHAVTYMSFFRGYLDQHMEEVFLSVRYLKGQSKNLQLAPGEFPDNMPLCIFSLNNMERSTCKSDFHNHNHVEINCCHGMWTRYFVQIKNSTSTSSSL